MNWRVLAKKDYLDSVRQWRLGYVAIVFVLFLGVPVYLATNPRLAPFESRTLFAVTGFLTFLVPIVALVQGHDAITSERELGSLKLLLAQPYVRRDVVVGTAVGRIAVLATELLVGLLVAVLVFVGRGGALGGAEFVAFVSLALLLGGAYSASAVGISAATKTSRRSIVGCIVFFFLSVVGWSVIPSLVRYVLNGFSVPAGPRPEWAALLDRLSPIKGYETAFDAFVYAGGSGPPTDAFYHAGWFGLLVLASWVVVPVAAGYLRFRSVDL